MTIDNGQFFEDGRGITAPFIPTMHNRNDMSGDDSVLPTQVVIATPGTAHRPFPTVRLGKFTFAAAVSTIRNAMLHVLRTQRLKTSAYQRTRRERPMCRSARERTEALPIKTRHVPHLCHSDRSVSGVEESTTWDDEPTQDKTCYLGRFLGSLRSLGMTWREVIPFCLHGGCNCHAPERHIGRSLQ